jgi:hypothetical protein
MTWFMLFGVWFRYEVINAPASGPASDLVDRFASAGNPSLQLQSNIRSFILLSHKV